MDAHRLQAKIFLEGAATPALDPLVPVFHGWIKHHRLNELLVDVANYSHVPQGPGVGVVGHEADYFLDLSDDRPGLLYSRKREAPAPEQRLADTFRRAFHAALLLQQEPSLNGTLRFRTNELLFRINDRLLAPATKKTFDSVRPELELFCAKVFGPAGYELELQDSPRQLFTVRIRAKSDVSLPTLLERSGGPPA
ncbi:MAG: hypothetical protein AB7O65_12070 [Candidatus Korobacteraceae bacterium]